MHTLIIILQAISALTLIVLMAVQTDKAEQGGVMGIGGAGGRSTTEIERLVGAERILKPMTFWMSGAFLVSSILAAIPADKVTFIHLLIGVALYAVIMMLGGRIWDTVTGVTKN